jgi:hypothetical protein
MRVAIAALMLLAAAEAPAVAQDAPPDLTGTWSGPFRTVIFGNNIWHPGSETTDSPPRVREVTVNLEVEGQDGALLWGRSWSDPSRKEPFAATITADGRTFTGADTDGALSGTITGPDSVDFCYTQTGLGPSKAIVASCGTLARQP